MIFRTCIMSCDKALPGGEWGAMVRIYYLPDLPDMFILEDIKYQLPFSSLNMRHAAIIQYCIRHTKSSREIAGYCGGLTEQSLITVQANCISLKDMSFHAKCIMRFIKN